MAMLKIRAWVRIRTSHARPIVVSHWLPARDAEEQASDTRAPKSEKIPVIPLYFDDGTGHRYRSLGCAPCTFPIKSKASNVREIIEELRHTKTAERSGRAQDKESEDAFEKLRRDGYM